VKGFFNSYLLIDLDSQTWNRLPLDDDVLQNSLGGKGLGLFLLREHAKSAPDPLSGDNPLVFAVGPASDSRIAGSSRWVVMARSPLTGFLAHSYSGGRLAGPMSRTGCDAFVLKGSSERPVWLDVTPQGVVFHNAIELQGMATYQAEEILLKHINARVGALVIGPAGENGVRFANITNDKWRQAGRTGAGAVMGAKKVKGITFRGDLRRPHADPSQISDYWTEVKSFCKDNVAVARYRHEGTPMMVAVLNNAKAFPTRYWHEGRLDGWESISADYLLSRMKVIPKACQQCFIACGKVAEALEGPHKGMILEGPEYETIMAFGGLCLIKSLEDILYLNDLCDLLGMDTISTGNLVAFAMEASEQGKFPEKIAYGDASAAAALINDIAQRKGSGQILADGIKKAAQFLGMEDQAIHVKGMEPAGYDPRVLKGMALAYGISDRGACHLRGTFYKAELAGMIDKDALAGKAELFIDFEDRATLFDSLILCRFYRDIYTWEQLSRIVRMTTGMDLGRGGLTEVAKRIADESRRFNVRMGLTRADDALPPRFHDEPVAPSGSVITRQDYEYLRSDYYRLRGWDENGMP